MSKKPKIGATAEPATLAVRKPLNDVLGDNGNIVRKALAWRALHGVAAVGPLVVVAMLGGRIVDGTLTADFVQAASIVVLIAVVIALVTAGRGNKLLFAGAYRMGSDLRLGLVTNVRAAPVGDVLARPRGEVASVIDRDVADVESFLNGSLPNLTSAAVAPVVLAFGVAIIDPAVGIATGLAVVLTAFGYRVKLRRQARHSAYRRRLRAAQDERVVEFVQGIEVAKAFGMRSNFASQLDQSLCEYRNENLRSVRKTIPVSAALTAGASFAGGLLLAVVGWRYEQGALGRGEVATLLVLVAGMARAFLAVGRATGAIPSTAASLQRIHKLVHLEPATVAPGGDTPVGHAISLEDVAFGYVPDSPVLLGVSFVAHEASVTAVVGRSGAGKTTILHLLAGLWTPDRGQIKIGGVPLNELSPAQRSRLLTIVLQDTYLPDGTIRDAIVADRDVDDHTVQEAAIAARCWDVIESLPHGLDTQVGEGGRFLSGGERQRVAIARALVADTPIVCLDEATAALDATTERRIQEAMASLLRNRTVVVVAHRPTTIRSADQIVVLDNGVVSEVGSHADLMARDGIYAGRMNRIEESSRRGFQR